MSLIKGTREIEAVDTLLALTISGSFFFRKEMAEYMAESVVIDVQKRLEHLYNKAVVFNCGRPFNPKYHFNRVIGGDTQEPKVVLQLVMPGNTLVQAKVCGEIQLDLSFTSYGALVLSLPPESPAVALAREHNWSVSEAELEALDKLLMAAKTLQTLGSKHLPIEVACTKHGIKIHTGYHNPVDQVRAALAR